MAELTPDTPPIFPPWEFVQRYNEARWPDPYRTALDPMVMLAWHQATEWQRRPVCLALIYTGC